MAEPTPTARYVVEETEDSELVLFREQGNSKRRIAQFPDSGMIREAHDAIAEHLGLIVKAEGAIQFRLPDGEWVTLLPGGGWDVPGGRVAYLEYASLVESGMAEALELTEEERLDHLLWELDRLASDVERLQRTRVRVRLSLLRSDPRPDAVLDKHSLVVHIDTLLQRLYDRFAEILTQF